MTSFEIFWEKGIKYSLGEREYTLDDMSSKPETSFIA